MGIKTVVTTSFRDKMSELDEQIAEDKRQELTDLSRDLTKYCSNFVQTGAFITSFSFTTGRGRPRGKSSHGLPKANKKAATNEAFDQLVSDLDKANLAEVDTLVLRNNSPHATSVDAKHGVIAYIGAANGNH